MSTYTVGAVLARARLVAIALCCLNIRNASKLRVYGVLCLFCVCGKSGFKPQTSRL